MLGLPLPSIAQGYAQRKTSSDNPELWHGVEFIFAPLLGLNGSSSFPDYSGFNHRGAPNKPPPNPQWVFDGQIKGYVQEWPAEVGAVQIDYGDIPTLRFESANQWTILSMFLLGPSFANDQRSLVTKWSPNQLIMRTTNQDPAALQILMNGSTRITGSGVFNDGVYYLAALRNDGTGASGGLDISVYTIGDRSTQLDFATGQHASDAALTATLQVGSRGSNDEMHGRIALTLIATQRWTDTMVAKLARDPHALFRVRDRITRRFVAPAAGGRIMSSLAGAGGLAGMGGIAGQGGGLAA